MRLKQDATWPCIATQRKCFLGKVDFSQDARVANALASEIGGRVGEIIGWAGRDLFRRGALLRRRCFWIFSFIIVIIFFFFFDFLDIVSVQAEADNFATAQCFPSGNYCRRHCRREGWVVSSFLGVATTGNTGQGVTLFVHFDYKGDMKADRNGASGLPASLQFSWRFHAVGRQNSAVKVMFIGNQSKRWTRHYSAAITFCNWHLLHSAQSKSVGTHTVRLRLMSRSMWRNSVRDREREGEKAHLFGFSAVFAPMAMVIKVALSTPFCNASRNCSVHFQTQVNRTASLSAHVPSMADRLTLGDGNHITDPQDSTLHHIFRQQCCCWSWWQRSRQCSWFQTSVFQECLGICPPRFPAENPRLFYFCLKLDRADGGGRKSDTGMA